MLTTSQAGHARFDAARRRQGVVAFTLPEVLICIAVIGVMFVSLYTGITTGFGIISMARENLRATQIMTDRMEEMRLYTWTQVTSFGSSTSYIPSSFIEPFFPTSSGSSSFSTNTAGFNYYGFLSVKTPAITESYSNDLREVVVTINWTNGSVPRTRSMSTFVSQYGMQNYIY